MAQREPHFPHSILTPELNAANMDTNMNMNMNEVIQAETPIHPPMQTEAEMDIGARRPVNVYAHPQQQEQAHLQYPFNVRAAMQAGQRMPQFAGGYCQGIPQLDRGYGHLPLYPANQALVDMIARFRPGSSEQPAATVAHSSVHFHGHPTVGDSLPPSLPLPPGARLGMSNQVLTSTGATGFHRTVVSTNASAPDNRPDASLGGPVPYGGTIPPGMTASPETKVASHMFVAEFSDHFHDDQAALESFRMLCSSYNRNDIGASDFFIGIYRMVYKAQSHALMNHFMAFLPDHWKGADFTWLDREIEREIPGMQVGRGGGEMLGQKGEKGVRKQPQKRKKVPMNGFRAGGGDPSAREEAMLGSIPGLGYEEMFTGQLDDTESSDSTLQRRTKIAKLPLGNRVTKARAPKATPTKRPASTLTAASLQSSSPADRTSSPYKFKAKHRGYSRLPASEVPHVGPIYPTRHSILHRKDKPYICGLCGESYAHPTHVADHHGKNKNNGGGACWSRHGKPMGEGAKWDSHESCKVGYRDVDYTRVKEGFVVLDRDSADKIEAACEAGRRFKGERGGVVDLGARDGDEGVVEDDGGVMEQPRAETGDAVLRAASFGLRERK